MSARQLISVVMLCLQAAGVAHLAFDAHVIADDGAVVDAARLTPDLHHGMHVCSPEVQGLGERSDECPVFAQLSAPGLRSTTPTELINRFSFVAVPMLSSISTRCDSVLARAPKASPPAVR